MSKREPNSPVVLTIPEEGESCLVYYCPKCGTVQQHTPLSRSEIEVLRAYAQGLGTTEIANLRFVSVKTIEAQRAKLLLKMGMPNVVAAVVRGIKTRLILLEED